MFVRTSLFASSLFVAALVGGCHHADSSSTMPAGGGGTTAATAPASCDQVADHAMTMLQTKDAPPELTKKVRDMMANACTRDAWSADARSCLLAIKTLEESDKCETMLTQDQRDKLDQDGRTLAPPDGNVGGGGPPPAPPAPAAAAPATIAPAAAAPPMVQPSQSRAAARKSTRTGDPCEGGE